MTNEQMEEVRHALAAGTLTQEQYDVAVMGMNQHISWLQLRQRDAEKQLEELQAAWQGRQLRFDASQEAA